VQDELRTLHAGQDRNLARIAELEAELQRRAEAMRAELDAHVTRAIDSAPPIDPVAFAKELERDTLHLIAKGICIAILDGVGPAEPEDLGHDACRDPQCPGHSEDAPESLDLNDSNDWESTP
jgi:hypothetical protein